MQSQLVIRKFSAMYLIVLTICYIIGSYGTLIFSQNYFSDMIGGNLLRTSVYNVLSVLMYFGFLSLWGLLILRKKLNTKFITWVWSSNLIGLGWFWFMNQSTATMKGFETAMWLNIFILAFNGFLAIAYIFSEHD